MHALCLLRFDSVFFTVNHKGLEYRYEQTLGEYENKPNSCFSRIVAPVYYVFDNKKFTHGIYLCYRGIAILINRNKISSGLFDSWLTLFLDSYDIFFYFFWLLFDLFDLYSIIPWLSLFLLQNTYLQLLKCRPCNWLMFDVFARFN